MVTFSEDEESGDLEDEKSKKGKELMIYGETLREEELMGDADVVTKEMMKQTEFLSKDQMLETRQSGRIKLRPPVSYATGAPVNKPAGKRIPLLRAGITELITKFPYVDYDDNAVIKLYTDSGFSLGTDDRTRLKVVKYFKSLSQNDLSTVLHNLLDKLGSNSSEGELDISSEVVPLKVLKGKK